MERGRPRFSRINLAKAHATSLSVTGQFDQSERWNEILRQRESASSEQVPPFLFSRIEYPAKEPKHAVTAMMYEEPEPDPCILLFVRYTVGRGDNLTLPVSETEAKWISAALELGRPRWLRASVRFRLADKCGEKLWFPLPARLGGKRNPTDQFDIWEVRGFKLDDRVGEVPEYSFSLECSTGKDARIEVSFPIDGAFDPRFAAQALARAKRALPDLVTLED